MSLSVAVTPAIVAGIQAGINPSVSEEEEAVPQFPTTAADLASITPNLGSPSYIWAITEEEGNLTDSIASQVLTANGTPGYAEASNSDAFPGKRAVTFDLAEADYFSAADPFFTVGTGSFGQLFVIRFGDQDADRTFWRKRSGSGAGFQALIRAGEQIRIQVRDSVSPVQVSSQTASHTIGTDYVVIIGVDRSAGDDGQIVILSHDGTNAVGTIAETLTATGDISSTGAYHIGSDVVSAACEIVYTAAYLGESFEGVTIDDAAAFAQHIGLGA